MSVRKLAGQRARVGVELLEGDEADVGVVERREEQPTRVDRKPDALGTVKNLFWKLNIGIWVWIPAWKGCSVGQV